MMLGSQYRMAVRVTKDQVPGDASGFFGHVDGSVLDSWGLSGVREALRLSSQKCIRGGQSVALVGFVEDLEW
jgi:hypothetical protein